MSRSGSQTRQRTEQVKLNLLPAEREDLERRAKELGFVGPGSVQKFIMMLLDGDLVRA
ncbi:MAG: hypothetical protein PHQ28_00560 [Mycobacterium sp.]|nr:hypothetical protein [Mycobacterium sp.]